MLPVPSGSQQHGELHHHGRHHRPQGSLVGRPIHFTAGQFAGKTIRAELHELQAAAFWPKVDRRPLDPPPVAWVRLFEVFNADTEAHEEREVDYDSIHILGLMCTVDLLPISGPSACASRQASPTTPYSPVSASAQSPSDIYAFSPLSQSTSGYTLPSSPGGMSSPPQMEYSAPDETHKATAALAGTTFVQVDSIPWAGKTCLLFTFNDLAVKAEGHFVLQCALWSCSFDLFSRPTGHTDQPIQADCCGAPFRIYSSKEVPALGPSTELTKHLARYGVRVNVRETERKRKKKDEAEDGAGGGTGKGKGAGKSLSPAVHDAHDRQAEGRGRSWWRVGWER
ncbi:velvet factor-domain-containing protein [Mycena galericulata]|nr:velvet factor-domain-containing protein [Mycena galericulata]